MKTILFLISFTILSITSHATTWTVDSLNNSGYGSLRAAVDSASNGDTVKFNPNLIASGSDSIVLSTQLSISKELTIIGLYNSTDTLFLSGGGTTRMFSFTGSTTIVLDSMVLINGYSGSWNSSVGAIKCFTDTLIINNSFFKNNKGSQGVGGVQFVNSYGYLEINQTKFQNQIGSHLICAADSITILNSEFIGSQDNPGNNYNPSIDIQCSTLLVMNSIIKDNQSEGIRVISNTSAPSKIINCEISQNQGSGIKYRSLNPYLKVSKCTIIDNWASTRSAIECSCDYSGSFVKLDVDSTIIMNTINNTFSTATTSGIRLYSPSSGNLYLDINHTSISGFYSNVGGGISLTSGGSHNTNIQNSTISNNHAGQGGGIYSRAYGSGFKSSIITVTNSTFVNNTAFTYGGAIMCSSGDNTSGTSNSAYVMLTNSTITNNTSGYLGNGIYVFGGSFLIQPKSSVIVNGVTNNIVISSTYFWVTSVGYNTFSDSILAGSQTTDFLNIDSAALHLDSLSYNGGLTRTMLPQYPSVLLNNGNPLDSTDAQNAPIKDIRDIGAAESCISTTIDNITVCDSLTWIDGNTYTDDNNTAFVVLTNSLGCDSVVVLNLNVMDELHPVFITACDSFTWINGLTYMSDTSGIYDTLVSTLGCDSVVVLNLTLHNSTSSVDTIIACNYYTWINGVTYTSSNNTAKDTILNSMGCDSIVSLNLTINYSSSYIDTHTVCDSLTWIDGVTYTANNSTASIILTNSMGCDSLVTLDLTIWNNSSHDTIILCDSNSYTWINGITYYTNNNSASDTLINLNGCDSVVFLNLEMNFSSFSSDTLTSCDSLTWINGVTYTASTNTVTDTLVNATGCDSIINLNLTINNTVFATDTVNACDSITWINGITYTSNNNIATDTLASSTGCDSVVTLNLTITYSTFYFDTLVACDSLTWINGVTYYSNNITATDTLTNSIGCDSIVYLNLTILNQSSAIDSYTVCDSLTWIDGITYYSSNNSATYTYVNSVGCDSIVTLDLTVSNLNSNFTYVNLGSANFSFTNSSTGSFTNSHWAFGDGSTSTSLNAVHHYSSNGTYVVVLAIYDSNVVGDSCISYFMDTISVTAASNSTSCNAGWVIYTDSSSGGVTVVNSSTGTNLTYHWDFGDGDTSNLQFPSHTYASNGPFNLCLTINDGNGCSDSYCDSITSNGVLFKNGFDLNVVGNYPLGIQNIGKEGEVKIYPNPTSTTLTIETQNFKITKIQIRDNTGKLVKTITSDFEIVNVESLATGVYHLELIGESETVTKKFIKQ